MTDRLYFADPYLATFTATVVARVDREGHPAVALDRSAFYPEGGGQPADQGWLDGVHVVDVQSDDDGTVWHVLEGPLDRDQVDGRVDIETARCQASFHLAMEAGAGSGFKILGFTLAQFKGFVDGPQRFTNGMGGCKRAEILSIINADFSDD